MIAFAGWMSRGERVTSHNSVQTPYASPQITALIEDQRKAVEESRLRSILPQEAVEDLRDMFFRVDHEYIYKAHNDVVGIILEWFSGFDIRILNEDANAFIDRMLDLYDALDEKVQHNPAWLRSEWKFLIERIIADKEWKKYIARILSASRRPEMPPE